MGAFMAEYKLLDQVRHAQDEFVGSHGGPILILPEAFLNRWWGVFNDEGKPVYQQESTDYDRACVGGDLPLKISLRDASPGDTHSWALVLECPDPSQFVPIENGVLVVRWVGAETTSGLLSVALQVPEAMWELDCLRLEVPSGGLAMLDSAGDGRRPGDLDNGLGRIDLTPGTYAIDRLVEVDTTVEHPAGNDEEVMTQLIRFRLV
jgi:hypothetical protein